MGAVRHLSPADRNAGLGDFLPTRPARVRCADAGPRMDARPRGNLHSNHDRHRNVGRIDRRAKTRQAVRPGFNRDGNLPLRHAHLLARVPPPCDV